MQPRRVCQRRTHHGRDRKRRIRLGEGLDEVAADSLAAAVDAGRLGRLRRLRLARGGNGLREQLLEELAHRRAVALDGAWRERRVYEAAQARVVGAVDVQDVATQLLVQRALG